MEQVQAAQIDTEIQPGLTTREARQRLDVFGPNSLPAAKPPSVWDRMLRLAREPIALVGAIGSWLLVETVKLLPPIRRIVGAF